MTTSQQIRPAPASAPPAQDLFSCIAGMEVRGLSTSLAGTVHPLPPQGLRRQHCPDGTVRDLWVRLDGSSRTPLDARLFEEPAPLSRRLRRRLVHRAA